MLITSISGIRGTIGGKVGENLTPIDVVSFITAYGIWIMGKYQELEDFSSLPRPKIIVGRDARRSGIFIMGLTLATLQSLGIDVIQLDLAATPTVEMEVIKNAAQGGIIITASHNPKEYNGIKMLNEFGEFLSAQDGKEILALGEKKDFLFPQTEDLGSLEKSYNHTLDHIQKILDLDLVDAGLVRSKKYKVVVDAINSVGGIAVPLLLDKLGVEVVGLNITPNGEFAHKPEPLEENLGGIKDLVVKEQADLGIVVDPDVDRLVFIDEKGNMFGEEYTIVAVADYVLSVEYGNTVSNLSSSRALADVTKKRGGEYFASAVGEKNVVEKMKEVSAVIGGEGSGGVIYPALHYGRDALVGIALFLSYLAKRDISVSDLRAEYPNYFMSKKKIALSPDIDVDRILEHFWKTYQPDCHPRKHIFLESEANLENSLSGIQEKNCVINISNIDGVKIDFEHAWVHLRKSNTEPIIRIFTEAQSQEEADALAEEFIKEISKIK